MAPAALALLLLAGTEPSRSGSRELELGVENLFYATAGTALNQGNLLGLDRHADLLRGNLNWKESAGDARLVFRGYVERSFSSPRDETRFTLRQAYAQYGWGSGLSLRAGKQRVAWGSGFAWNPTNRLDPAKNPLNPSLEQEGALAARLDWIPVPWAGVVLVAARSASGLRDFPLAIPALVRRTAAVRARFLVKDSDIALVFSGGKGQRTLLGLDLGRDVGGVSVHAEAAFYRGAELPPVRSEEGFFRLSAGLLHASGPSALSLEYFYNGEGYAEPDVKAYLARLAAAAARASDPALPPALRESARAGYASGALLPYSGGLGLRRHYLFGSLSRGEIRGEWTLAARAVLGLADGGVALTPGVAWAPRADLTLNLDAVLLLGRRTSEFRLAPLRTAVQARLKLLF